MWAVDCGVGVCPTVWSWPHGRQGSPPRGGGGVHHLPCTALGRRAHNPPSSTAYALLPAAHLSSPDPPPPAPPPPPWPHGFGPPCLPSPRWLWAPHPSPRLQPPIFDTHRSHEWLPTPRPRLRPLPAHPHPTYTHVTHAPGCMSSPISAPVPLRFTTVPGGTGISSAGVLAFLICTASTCAHTCPLSQQASHALLHCA